MNKQKVNKKLGNTKQYGRYEIIKSESICIEDAFTFLLENTYHDNDFWIPITDLTQNKILGFLKFKKVGEATFLLDSIRQGHGSMLSVQDSCKESLKYQQERS